MLLSRKDYDRLILERPSGQCLAYAASVARLNARREAYLSAERRWCIAGVRLRFRSPEALQAFLALL